MLHSQLATAQVTPSAAIVRASEALSVYGLARNMPINALLRVGESRSLPGGPAASPSTAIYKL